MAVRRSYLRVVGFSATSLGVYTIYWFYVTRKQLTKELGTSDQVGLQTLGLFVPILNFFITYWLWRDIDLLRQRVGLERFDVGKYMAANVVGAFFGLQFVVYLLVLEKLNHYYDRSRGGRAPDAPITSAEIAVAVVPGVVFALLFVLIIVVTILSATADDAVVRGLSALF